MNALFVIVFVRKKITQNPIQEHSTNSHTHTPLWDFNSIILICAFRVRAQCTRSLPRPNTCECRVPTQTTFQLARHIISPYTNCSPCTSAHNHAHPPNHAQTHTHKHTNNTKAHSKKMFYVVRSCDHIIIMLPLRACRPQSSACEHIVVAVENLTNRQNLCAWRAGQFAQTPMKERAPDTARLLDRRRGDTLIYYSTGAACAVCESSYV